MEISLVPPVTLDAPDSSPSPLPGSGDGISNSSGEPGDAAVEAGPHGALFLVLGYLRLPELFAFQRVCRLFRDAIAGDCLLWRHITVEPPLSGRLTDDALVRVTSRAGGKLASLALLKCWKITDAGLLMAVEQNPTITKLYVPGCTYLTADGVVRVVKQLSEQKGHLKCLRLHGVFDITEHHLDLLSSFLGENDPRSGPQPSFYNHQHTFPLDIDDGRPIDVDVCPKCKNVRLVFDCTRENCRNTKQKPQPSVPGTRLFALYGLHVLVLDDLVSKISENKNVVINNRRNHCVLVLGQLCLENFKISGNRYLVSKKSEILQMRWSRTNPSAGHEV